MMRTWGMRMMVEDLDQGQQNEWVHKHKEQMDNDDDDDVEDLEQQVAVS